MGRLFLSLSMSLDGFITGPDPRAGEPLGDGVRLFDHLDAEPIELERTRIMEGSEGVTHLTFRVVK